jgi:hypothetical protein
MVPATQKKKKGYLLIKHGMVKHQQAVIGHNSSNHDFFRFLVFLLQHVAYLQEN